MTSEASAYAASKASVFDDLWSAVVGASAASAASALAAHEEARRRSAWRSACVATAVAVYTV